MAKFERFISGHRYRFTKDWEKSAFPLNWYAKKGDIVIFNCRGFRNTGRFYTEKDKRLIIISAKEVSKIIEEV
jgi:hypothetical protein